MRRALLLLCVLAALPALPGAEDPLRERLRGQAPPWYDRDADAWKRIEVKPPEAPKPPASPGVATLGAVDALAWIIVIAAALGLAWVIWQLLPRDGVRSPDAPGEARRPAPAAAAISELDLGEAREPEEALAAARAAGDWARAVVWLYAILLVRLDRAGAVRLRRGATNRRYRREAEAWSAERQAPADLLPALDAAVDAFERVFFGRQGAAQAQVDALEGRIRALERGLPEGGA